MYKGAKKKISLNNHMIVTGLLLNAMVRMKKGRFQILFKEMH